MRLSTIGFLLLITAVVIPVITIPLILLATIGTTPQAINKTEIGGAIVVFPIPVIFTFGTSHEIITPLAILGYILFLIFLIFFIVMFLRRVRAKKVREST